MPETSSLNKLDKKSLTQNTSKSNLTSTTNCYLSSFFDSPHNITKNTSTSGINTNTNSSNFSNSQTITRYNFSQPSIELFTQSTLLLPTTTSLKNCSFQSDKIDSFNSLNNKISNFNENKFNANSLNSFDKKSLTFSPITPIGDNSNSNSDILSDCSSDNINNTKSAGEECNYYDNKDLTFKSIMIIDVLNKLYSPNSKNICQKTEENNNKNTEQEEIIKPPDEIVQNRNTITNAIKKHFNNFYLLNLNENECIKKSEPTEPKNKNSLIMYKNGIIFDENQTNRNITRLNYSVKSPTNDANKIVYSTKYHIELFNQLDRNNNMNKNLNPPPKKVITPIGTISNSFSYAKTLKVIRKNLFEAKTEANESQDLNRNEEVYAEISRPFKGGSGDYTCLLAKDSDVGLNYVSDERKVASYDFTPTEPEMVTNKNSDNEKGLLKTSDAQLISQKKLKKKLRENALYFNKKNLKKFNYHRNKTKKQNDCLAGTDAESAASSVSINDLQFTLDCMNTSDTNSIENDDKSNESGSMKNKQKHRKKRPHLHSSLLNASSASIRNRRKIFSKLKRNKNGNIVCSNESETSNSNVSNSSESSSSNSGSGSESNSASLDDNTSSENNNESSNNSGRCSPSENEIEDHSHNCANEIDENPSAEFARADDFDSWRFSIILK